MSSTGPAPSEGSWEGSLGSIRTASKLAASLPGCNLALRTALHHQRTISCVLNRTDLSTEAVVAESANVESSEN